MFLLQRRGLACSRIEFVDQKNSSGEKIDALPGIAGLLNLYCRNMVSSDQRNIIHHQRKMNTLMRKSQLNNSLRRYLRRTGVSCAPLPWTEPDTFINFAQVGINKRLK